MSKTGKQTSAALGAFVAAVLGVASAVAALDAFVAAVLGVVSSANFGRASPKKSIGKT